MQSNNPHQRPVSVSPAEIARIALSVYDMLNSAYTINGYVRGQSDLVGFIRSLKQLLGEIDDLASWAAEKQESVMMSKGLLSRLISAANFELPYADFTTHPAEELSEYANRRSVLRNILHGMNALLDFKAA